jgi:hypothetical protein
MVSNFNNEALEEFGAIDKKNISEITDGDVIQTNSTLYLYCSVSGLSKTKSDFKGSLTNYIKIVNFNMKIKNTVKINASASIPEAQSMDMVHVSLEFYDNPFSFVLLNNWNQGKVQNLDLKIQRNNPSNKQGDYIIELQDCIVQNLYQTIDKDFKVVAEFSATIFKFRSTPNALAFS